MTPRKIFINRSEKKESMKNDVKKILLNLNEMTGRGFRFLDEIFEEVGVGQKRKVFVALFLENGGLVEIDEVEEEKIIRITKAGREIASTYKK